MKPLILLNTNIGNYLLTSKKFNNIPSLRVLDDKTELLLKTNNVKLSWLEKTVKINPKTVARQLSRLKDANVIVKQVSHGSKQNYELYINETMLSLYDLTAKTKNKYSSDSNTKEEQALESAQRTKCPPEKYISLATKNNLIIPVSDTNRSGDDFNFCSKEKKKIKNDYKAFSSVTEAKSGENPKYRHQQESPSREKEKMIAPAPEISRLREYQKDTGVCFFNYVMTHLFSNRPEIKESHKRKTQKYVAENYFIKCASMKEADKLLKVLEKRVDTAKRYIENNGIKMDYIFPGQYLDLSRKGINSHTKRSYMSFVNLALWDKKFMEFKKADKDKRRQAREKKTFDDTVEFYFKQPTLANFRKCEKHILEKLPHMLDEFLKEITKQKSA